ncbi:hypothetical protein [Mucilaginibacter segetis]|uniref:Uncharacterized protein n=1 Tax=Mucilaginibacter segetis TaxID=2793071 RepID=A0A934UP02_9SPHI|nr:hypothetical protein [Mucilaginibacter segetis]MBK0380467.1 hypothetical protein [Mucilaginibacter segetis]
MNNQAFVTTRPNLKTRRFSTLHIEIFEYILLGKTNRELNRMLGYTRRSHAVVDHSRKVMFKLLALENLSRRDFTDRIVYPRKYQFWWKKLLDKNKAALLKVAIPPEFYS